MNEYLLIKPQLLFYSHLYYIFIYPNIYELILKKFYNYFKEYLIKIKLLNKIKSQLNYLSMIEDDILSFGYYFVLKVYPNIYELQYVRFPTFKSWFTTGKENNISNYIKKHPL
tara:strand:- start:1191 stop:1529 length:339 start_codon:yes stop_codon:yes gene_type:complete